MGLRILVVSQFYPPEPGAGQNRVGAFVDGLLERGHAVTVICEQPNHPSGVFQPGYGRRPLVVERDGALTVRRLWVAASPEKTLARRGAFYASFSAGAGAAVLAAGGQDVPLVSSPPLPQAFAAGMAARARGLPLVLDVRDIWSHAVAAVDVPAKRLLVGAVERLERTLFRSARHVTTPTRAFARHIDASTRRPVAVHLPNGVSGPMLGLPERERPQDGPLVVGYAGNLGLLHDLPVVMAAADRLRTDDVRLRLVGDGALAQELQATRERLGLERVELRRAVPLERLGEEVQDCDVMLAPVAPASDLDAVVPSKIYDAMAAGRAVLTSARGEAAELVNDVGCGLVVAPGDPEALAAGIRRFAQDRELARRCGRAGRAAAASHDRAHSLDRLDELLHSAAGRG